MAGNAADAHRLGSGIGEELGPGHQGGVVDVGTRNFPGADGAGEVAHLAQVVGHIADAGDPAVKVPLHLGQRVGPVGWRRQVLVGVDQAGRDIEAGGVDHLGVGGKRGPHADDPLALDEQVHARPRRGAGSVDDGDIAVEDGRRGRLGLGRRHGQDEQ